MKFGVMLNHQYGKDEDLGRRIEEGVHTTELIRDLGFDLLFSHHHFLANMQTPQPVPVLAHLVPFSGTMRFGIGVYIATLEHPVALAETFATLDQISGGRLIVRAAAHCDTWLASPNVKFRWANGNLAAFNAEQERLGIDTAGVEYPIVRELYVSDSDEQAREELHEYIWNEYRSFSDYDPIYRDFYDEMWEKAFLIGSPDTVAEKLEILVEGGWNTVIFRADWAGMPVEMVHRSLRRFADDVMPRFTSAGVAA